MSKCWDQHAKGKSLLTLNFIVSVVQDPEVLKLLPLTSFYVVHIKIYFSPKCPLQCNSSRAPAIRTVTAARYLGVWPICGEAQISGDCDITKQELKYCNSGETTQPNIVAAEIGKMAMRPLQSERD